jgi:hypothetical protein
MKNIVHMYKIEQTYLNTPRYTHYQYGKETRRKIFSSSRFPAF